MIVFILYFKEQALYVHWKHAMRFIKHLERAGIGIAMLMSGSLLAPGLERRSQVPRIKVAPSNPEALSHVS
jgi:hypothetical protein